MSISNVAGFLFDASYVLAIGADGAVWYGRLQGGTWTGWTSLGGVAISAPAATRRLTAAGFSPWTGLGGLFLSYPGAGGTQVLGVGLDGDLWTAAFL